MSTRKHRPNGFASVLALLLLCVLATLCVGLGALASNTLVQADNQTHVQGATLAAESGMSFMLDALRKVRLPGDTTQATFLPNLAAALGTRLDGGPNLDGGTVTNTGTAVLVPSIALDDGSFSAQFSWVGPSTVRLDVLGNCKGVSRRVAIQMTMVPKSAAVFDYGLASRGPIDISGSCVIRGVNNPAEASVLSTTDSHVQAITVGGNANIAGDLSTSGEGTSVGISGSPTIAGSSDPAVIQQHIHLGIDPPDWPVLDTSGLIPLAINTVDHHTNLNVDSMTNIRIKAGTNPNFTSDIIINGVVYIEAPNQVSFEGRATLNGLIVTQESAAPLTNCQIFFAGGVEALGVAALPDTPQFAAVKQQTGTFILAPGFGVTFAGHVRAVNGTIAADQLTFTGTADGVVKGSILGLKDLPTSVGGNVEISIDRANADPNPAGFLKSYALIVLPGTYAEVAGTP